MKYIFISESLCRRTLFNSTMAEVDRISKTIGDAHICGNIKVGTSVLPLNIRHIYLAVGEGFYKSYHSKM